MKPSEKITALAQASSDEKNGKVLNLHMTHFELAIMQYLDEQAEKEHKAQP